MKGKNHEFQFTQFFLRMLQWQLFVLFRQFVLLFMQLFKLQLLMQFMQLQLLVLSAPLVQLFLFLLRFLSAGRTEYL